jgi:hypothetical protein
MSLELARGDYIAYSVDANRQDLCIPTEPQGLSQLCNTLYRRKSPRAGSNGTINFFDGSFLQSMRTAARDHCHASY